MFHQRVVLSARWVGVMDHRRSDRAMDLSEHKTRCVRAGELHELLVCTEDRQQRIDHVSYLGFAEFLLGGVLAVGDVARLTPRYSVRVIGFDYTHMPNHMNIVARAGEALTGKEAGLELSQSFTIGGEA